jgi:hypothetical protein
MLNGDIGSGTIRIIVCTLTVAQGWSKRAVKLTSTHLAVAGNLTSSCGFFDVTQWKAAAKSKTPTYDKMTQKEFMLACKLVATFKRAPAQSTEATAAARHFFPLV